MSNIKNSDKLLPNQPYFTKLYNNNARPIESAIYDLVSNFNAVYSLKTHKQSSGLNGKLLEYSTPDYMAAILCGFIKVIGAKNVLEIGTCAGSSSMHFADAVGIDGNVTTIEVGEEFANIARENFKLNGYTNVTLLQSDAMQVLKDLKKESFDFIYIDGSKEQYLEFALASERLLSKTGLIVVDDVFFHGDVFNESAISTKGAGCVKLMEHYLTNDRYTRFILPIGNGVLVIKPLS